MRVIRFLSVAAVAVVAASIANVAPASAHDSEFAGDLKITFGWLDEPTYAGLPNAIEATVIDADDSPVDDPGAQLTVAVSFGDTALTLPMVPTEPTGTFEAQLVPTQPGTYSIQLMGTVDGVSVNITSTCSDSTFDCVADASQIQFPPTAGSATPQPIAQVHQHSSTGIVDIAALAISCVALLGTGLLWIDRRRVRPNQV
jgi:hypothetical protein